jgi:hypothetical protein
VKGHPGHGYQPRVEQVPSNHGATAHIIVSGCTCGWKGKASHLSNREAWQEHAREQETHA